MMLDISSPRVIIPTILFAVSPNAPIMVILYFLISKVNGYSLTDAEFIGPVSLFITLKAFVKDEVTSTALFIIVFALMRKLFPKYY